jgi:AcrR family transcriptional regulator
VLGKDCPEKLWGVGMTVADVAARAGADHPASPFRRRLLEGLGESIGERGYRDTTIADIVRHARTSKRTFYDQFASKEECFIELLWTGNQEMIARISAAVDPEAPWQQQVRKAIAAYVDDIERRPAITLSWIRELPALGLDVQDVQRRGLAALIDMLVNLSDSPGFRRAHIRPLTRPMAVLIIGGLRELTAVTVEDGNNPRDIVETGVAASIAILAAGRSPIR